MSIAYIPARHFRTLLQLLEEQGHGVAPILAAAGLPEEFKHQTQDSYLTLEQVQTLIEHAVHLSGSSCLGVYLGHRLNLSAHGVVGFAGLSAATMGDALRVAQRFQALIMPLLQLEVEQQHQVTWVRVSMVTELAEPSKKFLLDALLSSIYIQGTFLHTGVIKDVTAYIPYPSEQYEQAAKDAFPNVEIRYGHDQLCVSFPNQLVEAPLALADRQTHEHALRQCEALLEAMPRPGGLAEQIRLQLMQAGPPFPSLEQLAQQQYMSERTLRRHLLQDNIRWRDLLAEVKMTLAKQYLMSGQDNITAIALKLGYQDSANFSRAFRQYTGLSPSDWRQY